MVCCRMFFSKLHFQAGQPLKSHLGTHVVDMSTSEVLRYLLSLQARPQLRRHDAIHNEEELALPLHGREAAEQAICEAFTKRRKFLSLARPPDDRICYPMVVCSGMSGLGKTRMLEEWPRLFTRAGIDGATLGVFLSYGNGHSPKDFEKQMPIEAAFSWRLLHRLFVEDNFKDPANSAWDDPSFLPSNAEVMSLWIALRVVRAGAEHFGLVQTNQVLSLFIGIDEYQNIPNGPFYDPKADDGTLAREKTFLWKLIAALDGCRHVPFLHIYPGFAGTRWGPLSIAGSSVARMVRAPMTLLRPSVMEDAIGGSEKLRNRLASPDFRRHLFFLGGIPRPSVLFALGTNFDVVWKDDIRGKLFSRESSLSPEELLRVVAVACSGNTVDEKVDSGIKNYTWGRWFDEGLCLQLDSGQLGVPYCVVRLVGKVGLSMPELSPPAKCMIQVLEYLCKHVDDTLYDMEPWQSWEKFSACFFALRVNSLLLLGVRQCLFSRLCQHAVVRGCNFEVALHPVEVHAIHESLAVDLPSTVTETMHRAQLDWVRGSSDGRRYCLINGTNGAGVDVFCALPLADDSGGLCLFNAQNKVVAASLGSTTASNLLAKAHIVPACLPAGSRCVRGLLSIMASFNQEADTLDGADCFVLSHRQHELFHGTLAAHPACKTWVDVNVDNVSTLRLLTSVDSLAAEIVHTRKLNKFTSVQHFAQWCGEQGANLSAEDQSRVVAYGRN